MSDLRDKIARALAAQTTCDGGPHPSELHFRQADAVLAVLDLDTIRALAQVEALEDLAVAHYLDGPQSIYDTIMRRADRIARIARIEDEGEAQ